mmetsp:Transcript_138955/g.241616  ORF Transcript_138955/g.241616 Transcript_138955/m.241616 type:complete len:126 (-) Transcript_138955:782-1159(-)
MQGINLHVCQRGIQPGNGVYVFFTVGMCSGTINLHRPAGHIHHTCTPSEQFRQNSCLQRYRGVSSNPSSGTMRLHDCHLRCNTDSLGCFAHDAWYGFGKTTFGTVLVFLILICNKTKDYTTWLAG